MHPRVVCISHVTAAGGDDIGRAVAKRLGYRYIDDEIITLAAKHAGVDPAVVADVEHHRTLVTRILDALFAPAEEAVRYLTPHAPEPLPTPPAPPLETLRRLIQDAITEIAQRGAVVIVAHGASIALAGRNDVLRVHVTASMQTRVQRLWLDNKLISESEYAKSLAETDRQRQKFLEQFYGIRDEQPTRYDLVINTDALDTERAVATIATAAS